MAQQKSLLEYVNKSTGTIPEGTYILTKNSGNCKIAEIKQEKHNGSIYENPTMFPCYTEGNTVNLKKSKNTTTFKLIYSTGLPKRINKQLIDCFSWKYLSKKSLCEFWGFHSWDLSTIFGEEGFNKKMLHLIFTSGFVPKNFEVWKDNKKINPREHKLLWEQNPKDYYLVITKRLNK